VQNNNASRKKIKILLHKNSSLPVDLELLENSSQTGQEVSQAVMPYGNALVSKVVGSPIK